jgi:hypothetical protein
MELRVDCDDSLMTVKTKVVDGIDGDFFGQEIPSRALPGPFQVLKTGENKVNLRNADWAQEE